MPSPMPVYITGWTLEVAEKLDLVWQAVSVGALIGLCVVFLLGWIAVAVSFRR